MKAGEIRPALVALLQAALFGAFVALSCTPQQAQADDGVDEYFNRQRWTLREGRSAIVVRLDDTQRGVTCYVFYAAADDKTGISCLPVKP